MRYQKLYSFIYFICALFLSSGNICAQVDANYILTETCISEDMHKVRDYVFFDGLGRERMRATDRLSGNGSFAYYLQDITGEDRVERKYLPFTDNSTTVNPDFALVRLSLPAQYNDFSPYEYNEYDADGKIRNKYKAGSAWDNNPSSVAYITNTANDVRKYAVSVSGTPSLVSNGYYKPGSLYGIRHVNEDGMKMVTYTDMHGNKVLERRGEGK